ncbi:MAG TPA: right-handed parallel beta-helix repeat-containing protein [Bacteroidota bacterium]|mgnify:CR=1 FL=1|nr:right-handed parallel beta-helix repeat-containing protein [Bacteroidota bacterium]
MLYRRFSSAVIVLALITATPVFSQLSGSYTIGGSSPTYATFAAAVAALSAGVNGPVVFNVRSGTYPEQISIPSITGVSATNTVTFQSESGSPAAVTMSLAPATNNYIVQLDGADYVQFKNIGIKNTSTSMGVVVRFGTTAASTNCLFEGCILEGSTTGSTSVDISVVYVSGQAHNDNVFRNNTVLNGSNGFYFPSSTATNMRIEGNTINNSWVSGVWLANVYNPTVIGNTINLSTTGTSTQYGLYVNNIYTGFTFDKNKIMLLGGSGAKRGIQFWNSSIVPDGFIRNNFVTVNGGTSTSYCFYVSTSGGKKVYNNTFVCIGSATGSRAMYIVLPRAEGLRLINNIIVNHGGGSAFYCTNVSATGPIHEMNYNVYWGPSPTTALYWNSAYCLTMADFRTANGMDANSVYKDVTFANETTGDLHLGGSSQNDLDLTAIPLAAVIDDIDGDDRTVPYRGADEACYTKPDWYSYSIEDANGQAPAYIETPGTLFVRYNVDQPLDEATITITLRFFNVATSQLVHTEVFQVHKALGAAASGVYPVSLPSWLPVGFYRIEANFDLKNSCGLYVNRKVLPDRGVLLIAPGQLPCVVWPGDVNNDGVTNYADRKDLNQYIFDAMLRSTWLSGPGRYRAEAAADPLAYYTWTAQAGAPWYTPMGCYMDADGNGSINNFDYIAIKMNWLKSHGAVAPKAGDRYSTLTFDMSQNYPNPFNPVTTIRFNLPERSEVVLTIRDMLGRVVATPVNGTLASGEHLAHFDASMLSNGTYVASISMVGVENGLTFSKTIKMTLAK